MLQPCAPLRPEHVEEFIKHKRYYLVTQEYDRGYASYSHELFVTLLITPYSARYEAEKHLSLIQKNKYAAIIDLERTTHYRKLSSMLKGNTYILFYAAFADADHLNKTIYYRHKQVLADCVEKKYLPVALKREDLERVAMVIEFGEFLLDVYTTSMVYRITLAELERVIHL